jgi:hypothetical protein
LRNNIDKIFTIFFSCNSEFVFTIQLGLARWVNVVEKKTSRGEKLIFTDKKKTYFHIFHLGLRPGNVVHTSVSHVVLNFPVNEVTLTLHGLLHVDWHGLFSLFLTWTELRYFFHVFQVGLKPGNIVHARQHSSHKKT